MGDLAESKKVNGSNQRWWRYSLALILFLFVIRALSLEVLDLVDPTESRYANIAAEMYLGGDWLTPHVWYEGRLTPYFSKPPLHFWLTSLAYAAFGIDEWTARLPSLLAAMGIALCLYFTGRKIHSKPFGLVSVFVAASSFLFFLFAGASVTDTTLALWTTLALCSFWAARHSSEEKAQRLWGIFLFVFGALGFLTKGPVAIAIIGIAIASWAMLTRQWRIVLRLPWVIGVTVFLALTVPWFLYLESKNPGAFTYYFLNENFLRFLVKDYGDRYGSGHRYLYGTSWLFLFIGFLPWSVPFLASLWVKRKQNLTLNEDFVFFAAWAVAPSVLFTFARQILPSYILPAVPGLALASAWLLFTFGVKDLRVALLLKRLRVPLLVLIATAPILAGFFAGTRIEWIVAGSIVLTVGMVLHLLLRYRTEALWNRAVLVCFCTACWLNATVFLLQGWVAHYKSPEQMIRVITHTLNQPRPTLGIVARYAQSPYWIRHIWKKDGLRPFDVVYATIPAAHSAQIENLLLARKTLTFASREGPLLDYVPESIKGDWIWLKHRGTCFELDNSKLQS